MNTELLQKLKNAAENANAADIIAAVYENIAWSRVVLASSLGVEDQALTHLVCAATTQPRIFTLDTGRLFQQTYDTMERTMERYGFRYEVATPDAGELARMVTEYGPNLFYRSVEYRKMCCAVRKTRPLKGILATVDAWICGLRREQSPTRSLVEPVEWDDANGVIKVNPIYNWTEADVWNFIRANGVPYNPLQDRGFRSIGCAPCTRAIAADDDIRAGRWWWEEPEHKECGLHRQSAHQLQQEERDHGSSR